MNISFYTIKDNLDTSKGYGNAGFQVITSLQSLGHKVPFDDPDSQVQMSFCTPPLYKFHPNQYKIGYTPWESTVVPPSWIKHMNNCDEVWATSDWVANVYEDNGVTAPIHVYEHGLDPRWAPVERKVEDKVHFLHVGEPALRKGGQMAVDAFRDAFGDRTDVHLTVKAYHQHYLRIWGEKEFEQLRKQYNNVTLLMDNIDFSELLDLYNRSHVLVYPSYGEGFGFIPLQALGTGMPVISTYEWASYRDFITYPIEGRWDRSIWSIHPGNVLYPNYDQLVNTYLASFANIHDDLNFAYKMAPEVHDRFNWLKLTENAFKHLTEN